MSTLLTATLNRSPSNPEFEVRRTEFFKKINVGQSGKPSRLVWMMWCDGTETPDRPKGSPEDSVLTIVMFINIEPTNVYFGTFIKLGSVSSLFGLY